MAISRFNTNTLILCSIFAALTAVGSQIFIPLPFSPVPINLALLFVFLSGSLLGAKGGAVAQIVYVLLGLVGLPVFAGLTGGPGIVAGPTGGYIIGYILAAIIIGLFHEKEKTPAFIKLTGYVTGLAACYLVGTAWFMYVTSTGLIAALFMCVIPFLIGDALKIAAAYLLTLKIKPFLYNL